MVRYGDGSHLVHRDYFRRYSWAEKQQGRGLSKTSALNVLVSVRASGRAD